LDRDDPNYDSEDDPSRRVADLEAMHEAIADEKETPAGTSLAGDASQDGEEEPGRCSSSNIVVAVTKLKQEVCGSPHACCLQRLQRKNVRVPPLQPVALAAYISCYPVYHNACPLAVANALDDFAGVFLTASALQALHFILFAIRALVDCSASALHLLCWKRSTERGRKEEKRSTTHTTTQALYSLHLSRTQRAFIRSHRQRRQSSYKYMEAPQPSSMLQPAPHTLLFVLASTAASFLTYRAVPDQVCVDRRCLQIVPF
jgi:hypothetical protein